MELAWRRILAISSEKFQNELCMHIVVECAVLMTMHLGAFVEDGRKFIDSAASYEQGIDDDISPDDSAFRTI